MRHKFNTSLTPHAGWKNLEISEPLNLAYF